MKNDKNTNTTKTAATTKKNAPEAVKNAAPKTTAAKKQAPKTTAPKTADSKKQADKKQAETIALQRYAAIATLKYTAADAVIQSRLKNPMRPIPGESIAAVKAILAKNAYTVNDAHKVKSAKASVYGFNIYSNSTKLLQAWFKDECLDIVLNEKFADLYVNAVIQNKIPLESREREKQAHEYCIQYSEFLTLLSQLAELAKK